MSARRGDRWFLPGWWRFWAAGPQWSSTARYRIGVDPPQAGAGSDWQRWEAELPEAVADLLSLLDGTDEDSAPVALLPQRREHEPYEPPKDAGGDGPVPEPAPQVDPGPATGVARPTHASTPAGPDPRAAEQAAAQSRSHRRRGRSPGGSGSVSIVGLRITLSACRGAEDPGWAR